MKKFYKIFLKIVKQKNNFLIFFRAVKRFKVKTKSKKETLKWKENGNPAENLLKYDLQIKFRNHIKQKMNEVFSLSFCNRVTNNIMSFIYIN